MGELLNKIQTTLAAVDDIEKAIQERGLSTKGYTLLEYGNLIRRITGGTGSLYPEAMILFLKKITTVPTVVAEIHNVDTYEATITPPVTWFMTDHTKMFYFRDDVIACETFVTEKTDKNTKVAIVTDSVNDLVEIVEIVEEAAATE